MKNQYLQFIGWIKNENNKRTLTRTNFELIEITLVVIIIILVGILSTNDALLSRVLGIPSTSKSIESKLEAEIVIPTTGSLPTNIPTSPQVQKQTITATPTNTNQNDWGKTIKLDERTSASRFAPDDHMSTIDELNQAMNQYRESHGLPTLSFNSTLCSIAQNRAVELQQLGKLDGHAGAEKYMRQQQEFNTIDEVLFGGIQPVAGVHVVEWGWDTSLTGHHEAISDSKWRDGCAGIAGYFAVFEFGAR